MKHKAKKTIKLGRAVFILVLMAVMFGGGWVIKEYRQRSWLGKERFTVVRTENDIITIESFDPVTHEAVRVALPEQLEIETVGGRGRWKVGVLGQLAEKNGWKWAADSVTDYLGITYTAVDRDMNTWDKLNWLKVSRDLRWKDVKLGDTGMVSEATAVDEVKVLGLSGQWDVWAKTRFGSAALAQQSVGVKLINATSVVGLGAHAARVIESSGLKVSMVSSEENPEKEQCEMYGNDEIKSELGVKFLSRTFKCVWYDSNEVNTGEVEMILGKDYRMWWLGE